MSQAEEGDKIAFVIDWQNIILTGYKDTNLERRKYFEYKLRENSLSCTEFVLCHVRQ